MASTLEALLLAQMNLLQYPPQARLHQATSINLLNNNYTLMSFDASDVDTYNGHSTVTNNSRYVFQVPGTYMLLGGSSTSANTSGFRQISFRVNGGNIYKKQQTGPSPSFETVLTTSITLPFNAGDYVELGTWQNSGATLTTVTSDQSVWPWMDIYRISS